MSVRSHPDPAVYLALPVWLCAAIVFPLQIGVTGAPVASLVLYLAAAGALLSLADALHDPASYSNWQVAAFEWILRIVGLTVPAALAYSFGTLVAPAEPAFEQPFCATGSSAPGASSANLDWRGDDDCRVAAATALALPGHSGSG